MTRRHLTFLGLLAVGAVFLGGCSLGSRGGGAKLRPTNEEIRLISQSCFQGEIEPCG